MIRDLIKAIQEADIFKPADTAELARREEASKAAALAKRKETEERLGRTVDICPHCGADLRDEDVGVVADVVEYGSETLYYEPKYDSWEYGDRDTYDSETTGYHCGKCEGKIRRGRDFEVDAPH